MSSRVVYSPSGRPTWAILTVPDVGTDAGHRYRVLGDGLRCEEVGVYFTGTPTGRPPLPKDAPSRNGVARATRSTPTRWSDEHRAEARRLHADVDSVDAHDVRPRGGPASLKIASPPVKIFALRSKGRRWR
jgi:hypothetical protein